MFNVVIAEDEPLARVRLQRFLSKIEDIKEIFVAEDGQQAIELVTQHQPELLVLDIHMPSKDGLVVAKEAQKSQLRPPAVIFTTAYDEFALEAFKVNAIAYLMKPIQEQELIEAVQRAGQLNRLQANEAGSVDQHSLMLKRSASIESLKVNDIAYFRAEDKLVFAGMVSGQENIVDLSLKELEEKLTPAFFRVHRHTLINSRYLQRINKDTSSVGYSVYLNQIDKSFPVSRRQVSALKKYFANMCS